LLVLSTQGPCDQQGVSFGVMGVSCLLYVVCVVHSRCMGFLFHTLLASQFERFAGKDVRMASRLTVKQTQPNLHAIGPAHGHKTRVSCTSACRRHCCCVPPSNLQKHRVTSIHGHALVLQHPHGALGRIAQKEYSNCCRRRSATARNGI
jgi:hypothetical protein